MNDAYREKLRQETSQFHEQTMRFLNKEVSVKDFKGYSGGFGSYAQRGGQAFMLRLRMNQGVVTKDKMKFVVDACEKHSITKAHFTTCQTIQLHDLGGTEIAEIMADALNHNIVCRGGGGDFPRNVMCSPLSGVDADEHFDVLPYAKVCGDYLLEKIDSFKLPRKLKVAFNNSNKNETHANFRDLGFCANADHTFDVYCAGGLGNNPKIGVCVSEHIQPSECLYHIEAMVKLFMEHGNYENRAKARTRYMQETLGVDGLKEEYLKALAFVKENMNLPLVCEETILVKKGDGVIEHRRITKQKQDGLYAVYYHPIGGVFPPKKLLDIYETIKDMDCVEMRITPQQGAYLINCTAKEAQAILDVTSDSAHSEFEESVACIGASKCQVGLRDSQSVLHNAITYLREKKYTDHILPRVFFSGCGSSCGTNQIGRLGFQGTVKVIDKVAHPAFNLSIYGEDHFNDVHFGEVVGAILEDDVCRFLDEIAQHVQSKNMTYVEWNQQFPEELQTIISNYIK